MPTNDLRGINVLAVVAPEGYRDEELDEPRRLLEARGAKVTVASTRAGTCHGMMGGTVQASTSISRVDPAQFHGIFVVGGGGSRTHLWEDAALRLLVQTMVKQGKSVNAICLSPAVLAKAGLLRGLRATVWDDADAIQALKAGGADYAARGPVTEGGIVTAYGPSEAVAFGNAVATELVRRLVTKTR